MTTREHVTLSEFEAFIARPENHERRFELINGEIEPKPMPTDEHGTIAHIFSGEFYIYFLEHPIGRATIEARVRPTGSADNDRVPDVSVILGSKPIVRQGAVDYIPDICIEIQSPDDSLKKLRAKARFYLANGAKYAVIALPRQRVIELYPAEGDDDVLTVEDALTFGDLLPNFSIPVARLFPES